MNVLKTKKIKKRKNEANQTRHKPFKLIQVYSIFSKQFPKFTVQQYAFGIMPQDYFTVNICFQLEAITIRYTHTHTHPKKNHKRH